MVHSHLLYFICKPVYLCAETHSSTACWLSNFTAVSMMHIITIYFIIIKSHFGNNLHLCQWQFFSSADHHVRFSSVMTLSRLCKLKVSICMMKKGSATWIASTMWLMVSTQSLFHHIETHLWTGSLCIIPICNFKVKACRQRAVKVNASYLPTQH